MIDDTGEEDIDSLLNSFNAIIKNMEGGISINLDLNMVHESTRATKTVSFSNVLMAEKTQSQPKVNFRKMNVSSSLNGDYEAMIPVSLVLEGRSPYARAMIEIDADVELKETVTVVVPNLEGEGYTCEKVMIEYEWRPHQCLTCKTFCHSTEMCPIFVKEPLVKAVEVQDEGFQVVKGRYIGKKQSEKPFLVDITKTSNSFNVLMNESSSDDEDVENGYNETTDDVARDKSNTKEASTPIKNGSNIELVDVNSTGLHYTWNQKPKGETGILKKIDSVMSNIDFNNEYSGSYAIFQPYRISDHASAILKIQKKMEVQGYSMLKLMKKMRFMKKPLRKLLQSQGHLHDRVVQLRYELNEVQMALDKDPSSITLREEESVYLTAFTQETFDEERFLKQKSKIEWLQVGDTNSKFFHKLVKARVSRSRIDCITGHDNAIYKGNLVPNVFIQHYMQFIGTDNGVYPFNHEGLFVRRLSTDKAANMIRCVSDDEIQSVMFSIRNDKASSPDGYTLFFFKESWDVVGMDVCKVVRDFFSNGKLLQEINHTSLLPKISTPTRLNDYQPISCCNVIYKCISKIITNRIMDGLDDIISDNQSAFVPGRSISDNILLTQDFMHNYHLNRGPPRCAFKIDIQKAYDTVNWKFLEDILVAFGFHSNMVKWIMACVTNTSFSINNNDLIMVARGDVQSVRILIEALDEFKRVSGLVPSRRQLVIAVLSSMHLYWASMFILPAGIIHDIQQLMCGFLWCQGEMKRGKAKVSWDDVRWIHAYKLKKRSLWEVPLVSNVSWGWRKLLQIHNTVRPYFWYKIGNGEKASIWYDTWDELCPLMNHVSYRGLSNAGFDRQETVTNVVSNGSWTNAWHTVRVRGNEVDWFKLVWSTYSIPRHAIHMWLVMRKQLLTKDQMRKWDVGSNIDLNLLRCPLCKMYPDSHDHLFFECAYSSQVWDQVLSTADVRFSSSRWSNIMNWLIPIASKNNVDSIVGRLIVAASSYSVWQERNNKIHGKIDRRPEQVTKIVVDITRLKLASIRFKKKARVDRMHSTWKISNILSDGG
ncbi:hypothetical protein Tco_0699220 [Tanacetum coccineum]